MKEYAKTFVLVVAALLIGAGASALLVLDGIKLPVLLIGIGVIVGLRACGYTHYFYSHSDQKDDDPTTSLGVEHEYDSTNVYYRNH